jgi:hypothetical protein
MRGHFFTLISAYALAPAVAAQQTPEPVPRELAVALIDRFEMSHTPLEIVVGSIPRSFPRDAVPRANIAVLGGVEREWGAAVVAAVPERPDSALRRATSHLARAGWRHAEEDPPYGGFRPPAINRRTYCRANAALTVWSLARRAAAGSVVHLSVSYPESYSPCNTTAQRRAIYDRESLSLPTLDSPPGARMLDYGAGRGGGRDSRFAHARLATDRGATEVAAHYAAQLRHAGWTLSDPLTGNGMLVYRVKSFDSQKRPLSGMLMVVEVPETNQVDIMLTATRAMPDR